MTADSSYLPDGRRPVYLYSLTCQCIGSLGVAFAWNVPSLLTFRTVQAFGTSSGLSVGMGVIADIYKLEERGTASGVFWGVSSTWCAYASPALLIVYLGCTARARSCSSRRRYRNTLLLVEADASLPVLFRFRAFGYHIPDSARNESSWRTRRRQIARSRRQDHMGLAQSVYKSQVTEKPEYYPTCMSSTSASPLGKEPYS